MGQSSSRSRRRDEYRQTYSQHPPLPPLPPPPPPPPPTIPPHNPYPSLSQPNFSSPYYNPPPPPAAQYYYAYQPQPQATSSYGGLMSFLESLVHNSFPSYYRPNQGNVWLTYSAQQRPAPMPPYSSFPEASSSSSVPVPPFVEAQKAKTIKNDVNLHKDMILLEVDEQNQEQFLVSFVYDAVVDGSFTIYYFAKEGPNCTLSSTEEDIYKPRSYTFQQGTGKRFCQPSGHGIDFGFFDLDSLSKPSAEEVFPLVIHAQADRPAPTHDQSAHSTAAHVQITLAVIEKNSRGAFQVKVVKQILWIDGERYELQEIFGLVSSSSEPVNDGDDEDDDTGKECVICLTEPRNTAVFPCRHLCMCAGCAKSLRTRSNKCPICRQPVEKLMEINVNEL